MKDTGNAEHSRPNSSEKKAFAELGGQDQVKEISREHRTLRDADPVKKTYIKRATKDSTVHQVYLSQEY